MVLLVVWEVPELLLQFRNCVWSELSVKNVNGSVSRSIPGVIWSESCCWVQGKENILAGSWIGCYHSVVGPGPGPVPTLSGPEKVMYSGPSSSGVQLALSADARLLNLPAAYLAVR